jgi:hypothetical protein
LPGWSRVLRTLHNQNRLPHPRHGQQRRPPGTGNSDGTARPVPKHSHDAFFLPGIPALSRHPR